jgi:hypothetical protein
MTKPDVKGKKVHAVVEGDAKHKEFYALIMNPTHTILYKMTGKYTRFQTLMAAVEKWGKDEKVAELSWDAKLKKSNK